MYVLLQFFLRLFHQIHSKTKWGWIRHPCGPMLPTGVVGFSVATKAAHDGAPCVSRNITYVYPSLMNVFYLWGVEVCLLFFDYTSYIPQAGPSVGARKWTSWIHLVSQCELHLGWRGLHRKDITCFTQNPPMDGCEEHDSTNPWFLPSCLGREV